MGWKTCRHLGIYESRFFLNVKLFLPKQLYGKRGKEIGKGKKGIFELENTTMTVLLLLLLLLLGHSSFMQIV